MALPKFARALHANPSAVSAEPLEGAVKLRLGDGSVWIVFADTQHISEVPATVVEEEEEIVEQPVAAVQSQTPTPAPEPASDGNGNEATQKSLKVGSRKAAFFQALASVLAARGLSQDEIQDIIANLSATKRRNGGRDIDPSTPEGKLLAAARRLFFYLKRQSVTYWESKGSNFDILFDGKRVTFQFPDGYSISYPQ
jgi:hypothetical protein